MKRMYEFLSPNVSDWNSRHTGTGAMTQDGTVVISNDDDAISANASTVYQFDHLDKNTGKYIFKLVSNQFTFPSVSPSSLKQNGVKFDVDDESLWQVDIAIQYYSGIVGPAGLYAVPKHRQDGGFEYVLKSEQANSYIEIGTAGYLKIAPWLFWLKDYFISKGCNITADGYQAIIPGEYIEIVSDTPTDTIAKITILPQEIALEPERTPLYRLITTEQ